MAKVVIKKLLSCICITYQPGNSVLIASKNTLKHSEIFYEIIPKNAIYMRVIKIFKPYIIIA